MKKIKRSKLRNLGLNPSRYEIKPAVQPSQLQAYDSGLVDDADSQSEKGEAENKPTPESCGDCQHFEIRKYWIGCNKVEQKIKALDICPIKADEALAETATLPESPRPSADRLGDNHELPQILLFPDDAH
jgi:hypothetical protein